MQTMYRKWLAYVLMAALIVGMFPVMGTQQAQARVNDGLIAVDGSMDSAWDNVPVLGRSQTGGWQSYQIDNLRLTNDSEYLYYWVDAVNVPNWTDNGQFIDIALNVNGADSGVSGIPWNYSYNFSGVDAKPQFHIMQRISNNTDVNVAAIYAATDLNNPVATTDGDQKGAEFKVNREQGFEGKIPLSLLGLENGDTVRAIVVQSGNTDNQHGAFDVIPEDASNVVASDWNHGSTPNVQSVYSNELTLQVFNIEIDGSQDATWSDAPVLGRSEQAGWQDFHIDNLRLVNDGNYLYYWVEALNVENWQYLNLALNVNGVDSGVSANPEGYPFNFGAATAKPQYHIVHQADNSSAKLVDADDMGNSILSTDTATKGADFAVKLNKENAEDPAVGFEGKIPLSVLQLDSGDEIQAIAVLSGDNAGQHGAFDVIVEHANNEVADSWNEGSDPNSLGAYSSSLTLEGVIQQLTIMDATPAVGTANMPIDTTELRIEFNESVTETVYGGLSVTVVTYDYSISGNVLTFTIDSSELEYGQTIDVQIPPQSLESEGYGLLGHDLSYSLTVEPHPLTRRYVHFYYDRPERDYEGWNLWVWATGKTNDEKKFTETRDGMKFVEIPVSDGTSAMGFKVRLNDWDEEDITTDRYVTLAPTQRTAKVYVTQGTREIRQIPHLTGPELDKGKATFYYRDELLMRDNEMDSIEGVELVLESPEGTSRHTMSYDADNEYFVFTLNDIADGVTTYEFEVTRDSEMTVEDDVHNPDKTDGKSYIEYQSPSLEISASISPSPVHYDENTILSVQVNEGDQNIIKSVRADLSAIGGSDKEPIDLKLLTQTISVEESTTAGTKTIPVKVIDKYGNHYDTSTTVTIEPKQAVGELAFDWDEARIYFILTDRFENGDTSNDDPNGENYDQEHLETYHGGDFQGLINRLDYLDELGINTIWITPIVDNINYNLGFGQPHQYQYGYHGYWAIDFTDVDEHLGDVETFKTLIDEAHDRGIKIMVDVVLNHTGYGLKLGDTNTTGATNYPTSDDQSRFQNMIRKQPINDSDLFGELSGLPDLKTEDPAVRAQIVEWQAGWLERARTERGDTIDFFRVDTVKHVENTTWRAFKNALTEIKPDFKMIGEFYGGGVDNRGGYTGTGQMDSLLDFDFKVKAEDFVQGQVDEVESYLQDRNGKIDNNVTMGQFLSSHDEDGFLYHLKDKLKGKHPSYSSQQIHDKALSQLKVAASLQITAKGQPVVYYGEELGRTGQNANFDTALGENRDDMPWDQIGVNGELHYHYMKLLNIRDDHSKIFSKGTRSKIQGSNADEYLVFEREHEDEALYVGLNTSDSAQQVTLTLDGITEGMEIYDAYNRVVYTADANDQIEVTLPAMHDGGTFILTDVPAEEQLALELDTEALAIGFAGSNSASSVTNHLTLPVEGANGSAITWSSSDEQVIKVNGEVSRPASGQSNKTVTLTAEIENGEQSEKRYFAVTVMKRPSSGSGSGGVIPPNDTEEDSEEDTETVTNPKADKDGKIGVSVAKGKKKVLLPANAAAIDGKNSLSVQSEEFTAEIPADVLKQVQGLLSDEEMQDAEISFEFTALNGNETAQLLDKAKGKKKAEIQTAGEVYAFTLSIQTKEGKQTKLTQFSKPITLRLKVKEGADESLTGMYYVGDDGELEYVGGKVENGMMVAQVSHFSKYAVLEYNKTFADVKAGFWAEQAIKEMAAKQIIAGVTDTMFAPGEEVTRAQFAALIARTLNLQGDGEHPFADVKDQAWYAADVSAVYQAGIVNGRSKEQFAPDETITREEMAVMMVKAYEYAAGVTAEISSHRFGDEASISKWAADDVGKAHALDIMKGQGQNQFVPKGNATRAESAQVMSQLLRLING
ncbi:alpha-amylase family glycosyl hydrolase [Marinicrinis sediminis]|uniref:Alpha-amylase family glycosyl hydrolase n=1 Tax=Marinicrinis sediminis TaxID=1652465 RepID=A0ABW5R8L0_9BACL